MTSYTRTEINIYERLKAKGVKSTLEIAVFMWLKCNTVMNIAGLYRIAFDVLHEDLLLGKNDRLAVKKVLARLQSAGLIRYDSKSETVWVVGYIAHNYNSQKLSDNSIKALISALKRCRRLPFFNDLLREYPWLQPAFDENTLADAQADALAETLPDTKGKTQADGIADSSIIHHSSSIKNPPNPPTPQGGRPRPKASPEPDYPPELITAVRICQRNSEAMPDKNDLRAWNYLRNLRRDATRVGFSPWEIVTTLKLVRQFSEPDANGFSWDKQLNSFAALITVKPALDPDGKKTTAGQPIKFVKIYNAYHDKLRRVREQQAQKAKPPDPDISPDQQARNIAEMKRMAHGIGAKA